MIILSKPNSPQYLKKAKLITKGTIEEKILDLQAKKKILSDKLIENDGDEYKSFQNLSVDDIRELLKFNNE